ncbi:M20/M25/M40 family metallo-hydrolase [Simiduia curdlanivorans]|uniref:M20/M25/M40 family metallo-hydrolase n=1 Tax=Simiduia curdlanivorans TaxID=1492769 RepID=A0ABV8V4S8_9GAMM|nr:M20/M25/M40 family metallo-hydrolase [Simiduia curdlanivorans]MDN3640543.1 M20/M25/M40 family metallo-hydrolase [Simiduia curdlanivorans]
MSMNAKWCFFLLLFSCASCAVDAEQDVVRQIATSVAADKAYGIQLLERAVNINSGTDNLAGVKAVADVFAPEFEALGFQVTWLDGSGFNRAGHLVAEYGKVGPKILLIGHLDTVFAQDSEFQRFQVVDERYVRGPGITDMKGGDVVMLLALKALKTAGLLDQLQIRVLLTGDEESRGTPMVLATQALVEAGDWADIALGFEDGDSNPETAVIARRSAANWRLSVQGRPAHSSQIFQPGMGDGAIFEMARVLNAFREALSGQALLTFNPGVVVAGTDIDLADDGRGKAFGKANVIAASAKVSGDLRAISAEQQQQAWAAMAKIAAASLPHTKTVFSYEDRYPPMAPTEGNKQLLALYSQASEDLGYGPVRAVDPRKAGAADISFVAGRVDMALDGLGLMGAGGHTDQETADMNTLVSQAARAALLMARLADVK